MDKKFKDLHIIKRTNNSVLNPQYEEICTRRCICKISIKDNIIKYTDDKDIEHEILLTETRCVKVVID